MTEVKEKLGDVIKEKNNWAQHHLAKDAKGNNTSYTDPTACKFCLTGALLLLSSKPCDGSQIDGCRTIDDRAFITMGHKLADIIAKKTGKEKFKCFDLITDFNDADSTTFKMIQEVIEEFDK